MWQKVDHSQDALIAQLVGLQKQQDRRYSGLTDAWLKKWLSDPNNVLYFADEATHRLAFAVHFDPVKNRHYLTEMAYDGSITVKLAFEHIATEAFVYAAAAGFTEFYATQPLDPTIGMNALYAEVQTSPLVHVTILESKPKFHRIKVTKV